jgi:hypothetical protein
MLGPFSELISEAIFRLFAFAEVTNIPVVNLGTVSSRDVSVHLFLWQFEDTPSRNRDNSAQDPKPQETVHLAASYSDRYRQT